MQAAATAEQMKAYLKKKNPSVAQSYLETVNFTAIGTFTIVEEADGEGASRWGLLKSYQEKRNGWIMAKECN